MQTQTNRMILCGTDFSNNAAHASTVAAILASRWNQPLTLLHVADEFNANADRNKLADFLQPFRDRLQIEAEGLAQTGAAVSSEVLHGKVAEDAITNFIIEHPVELAVLSAGSKTAFDRLTLGSVSERIAEAAPAATLVVRSAAPFEAWARGERPLKVFVATDLSASAEAALQWVSELRKLGPCHVTAGYIDWPPEERRRLGLQGADPFENLPEMQQVLERDLREKVIAVLGAEGVEVRVHANWGSVDGPLIELARAANADLFVVGAHQRRGVARVGHPSVSRGILRHAPMTVACIPTSAAKRITGPRIHECKRVLVAVDLNEPHGFATPYGYSIVDALGTVRLLHNIARQPVPITTMGGDYHDRARETERARLVAESEAKLRALAPEEANARGVVTEVEVTDSPNAAEAICSAAERFGADIVCIGSHTRPGFTAKVFGSVSLAVLQACRRPVLLVWPPAE